MAYTRLTLPFTSTGTEGATITSRQLGTIDRTLAELDSSSNFVPADRGLLAENYPIHAGTGSTVMPTAGRLEFAKVRLPVASSVTNVLFAIATAGNTLTAGQCFAALYTAAGARVGVTADQAASWVSTGVKAMALASGPFACAVGDYYVAYWFNGTTGPALVRTSGQGSGFINFGVAAPSLFWGTADTSLTTTAPATMGSQTGLATSAWVALS